MVVDYSGVQSRQWPTIMVNLDGIIVPYHDFYNINHVAVCKVQYICFFSEKVSVNETGRPFSMSAEEGFLEQHNTFEDNPVAQQKVRNKTKNKLI